MSPVSDKELNVLLVKRTTQCWKDLETAITFEEIIAVWITTPSNSQVSDAALWKAFSVAKTRREMFQVFSPAKRDSELARVAAKALDTFPPSKGSWEEIYHHLGRKNPYVL